MHSEVPFSHSYHQLSSQAAIGVYDSGLGGLSVWRELRRMLPQESLIYFADRRNCPYGDKSEAEIHALANTAVQFLIDQGVKMIIVACNTATAVAIKQLRAKYALPFIGMEPAVKPAALHTQTGHIGVLATQRTLLGKLYQTTRDTYATEVEVHAQAGRGLVELVEAGKVKGEEAETLLREYLAPMMAQNIDQLVLGCTHYPFLRESIQKIMGTQVQVIDPARAVVKQVIRQLDAYHLRTPHQTQDTNQLFFNEEAHPLPSWIVHEAGTKASLHFIHT